MTRRFSEIFGLGLGQPQLDFVDIAPATDTPLFIDPFALSLRDDAWSRTCHQHITHFFQTALEYIRSGNEPGAQLLLNGLSEPNETCFGLSKGSPSGRGVGGKQAIDLYDSLATSQAAKTGILEELAESDLFVEGIGRDKISDITTNIIRRLLIEYTQAQCDLHGIPLEGTYPTGRFWNMEARVWTSEFTPMPVVDGKRIILVPKYSVRRSCALDAQEYYSQHIINCIQEEEFVRGSSLVRVLKDGQRRPPFKKALKEKFPFSKDFIARFSEANPKVLEEYKKIYAELDGAKGTLRHRDFDEDFDEKIFAQALIQRLKQIPPGHVAAYEYHSFIIGTLEFIFWPHLIYPKKETPIHDERKRIDITYTNAARDGFFYRIHTAHQIASTLIMVECKNYSKDPANPELDQLSGRFSVNRGKFGMLLYREVSDYDLMLQRCRDTASDGRGIVLPLGDNQLIEYLDSIALGNRAKIDSAIQMTLLKLIS